MSHENMYQIRPVVTLDVLEQGIEVLKPESIVLKIKGQSRTSPRYFDVGALCFRLRQSRFAKGAAKANSGGRVTEVVLASKEDWRVSLISSFIEHVRTEVITKSTSTMINTVKQYLRFFQFCEEYPDFNYRSQSFEGFLSIYRDFTDNLKHRFRLAPNNPLCINKASAASAQRTARRFLQHHFKKAEIDLIRYVPSIIRGKDKSSVVSAPETENRDAFIRFSFALFHELADGIISQDYAPFKIRLPVRESVVTHTYLDPTSLSKVVINQDLTWPLNEWDKLIKEHWPNASHHQIRVATARAKSSRSLKTSSHALSKAYILAQSAFIACFYAATGINPTQLINLEATSSKPKALRGMRFSGLKARAGKATVYPEFGFHFLTTFNKFKELRSYITNHFGDDSLWFFRPIFNQRKIESDRTIEPLKKFIETHGFNVPILTPTQIRKSLGIDFLKLSRGDLVITSKKLGNDIKTVMANYTSNNSVEQSQEFQNFYRRMFDSAIERARLSNTRIAVVEASETDFQTPSGHCSNNQNISPHRVEAFSEFAPKPDCSRPETCLFCEHYSIIPDREDIGKLLGLKELIKLVKTNAGVSDQYINFFAPIFHRVDEIIEFIREVYPQSESIITEVYSEIEHGVIHPFWDEHYEFLMELSLQV